MRHNSKQRGLTAISWLLVIAVAAIFVTLIIRLVPVYIDGFSVYESLESMKTETNLKNFPVKAVKKKLLTRLNINSVYSVTGDDIYVTKKSGKTTIEVEYEVRQNVAGNLDLVVSFQKAVTIQ